MKLEEKVNLKKYNTFGISAIAGGLIHVYDENDVFEVLTSSLSPIRILGGGSNVLFTGDIDGFILRNEIKGIAVIDEDESQVLVKVGAGEKWHQLVMWSLSHNLAGLENLSLIPGSVGAAPMQNIGAYGVEQESVFHSLNAIHLESGIRRVFFKDECHFGYRESVFKNTLKDQYFITHVTYVLRKKDYTLYTGYGAIGEVLQRRAVTQPTIHDISKAVIEIRTSKLPDPEVVGNAGSFFKNPVVPLEAFKKLQTQYADVPSYPVSDTEVKVPAGWLIEKAGYKGMVRGEIGVHAHQALVLVNYGGGSGGEIYKLALEISDAVAQKFEIQISPEVNIW